MENIKESVKNFNHISIEEREILALELAAGKNQKQIAKILNRHPSTISREIHRNGSFLRKQYMPLHADKRSRDRKARAHAKDRLKTPEIRAYVLEKLKEGWTPEQIAGRLSIDRPGLKTNHESIYLFIYKDMPRYSKYLVRSRRKRLKRSQKKGNRMVKIQDRVSIDHRPGEINSRSRIGDWEADTIISRESKAALVVLRERVTQFALIGKIPDQTADSTNRIILQMLEGAPSQLLKSMTFDNGSEFALHMEIAEELNIQTYFCNPYHSWEKGSVENTNGLIRRVYPKKTDFSLISDEDILKIQTALNNRPRKSLGFYTPIEALKCCA